jgi:hypothetical protein
MLSLLKAMYVKFDDSWRDAENDSFNAQASLENFSFCGHTSVAELLKEVLKCAETSARAGMADEMR